VVRLLALILLEIADVQIAEHRLQLRELELLHLVGVDRQVADDHLDVRELLQLVRLGGHEVAEVDGVERGALTDVLRGVHFAGLERVVLVVVHAGLNKEAAVLAVGALGLGSGDDQRLRSVVAVVAGDAVADVASLAGAHLTIVELAVAVGVHADLDRRATRGAVRAFRFRVDADKSELPVEAVGSVLASGAGAAADETDDGKRHRSESKNPLHVSPRVRTHRFGNAEARLSRRHGRPWIVADTFLPET
jgi:hypothetical protein